MSPSEIILVRRKKTSFQYSLESKQNIQAHSYYLRYSHGKVGGT